MSADLTSSINRLTRNLTITQVALHTKPTAALFVLNLEALLSSVEEALQAVQNVPGDTLCEAESAMGEHTANLLASALQGEPVPDTIPDDWKE